MFYIQILFYSVLCQLFTRLLTIILVTQKSAAAIEQSLQLLEARIEAGWASVENLQKSDKLPLGVIFALPSIVAALNAIQPKGTVGDTATVTLPIIRALKSIVVDQQWYTAAIEIARGFTGSHESASVSVSSSVSSGAFIEVDIASDGLVSSLKNLFSTAIRSAFNGIAEIEQAEVIVTRCTNEKFGDFQCNNAMSFSKVLKGRPGFSGKIS